MSTPTNPGTPQFDPQLDESIRISHLEPKAGTEKKLGFLSFGHGLRFPAPAYRMPQNLYTRQSTSP